MRLSQSLGGTILLGVQDDGTLQGIEPDAVTQIKKDFVTSVNNPLKFTPPTYLSVDVIELDGKSLLRIYCAGKLPSASLYWAYLRPQ